MRMEGIGIKRETLKKDPAILAQIELARLAFEDLPPSDAMRAWIEGGMAARFREVIEENSDALNHLNTDEEKEKFLQKLRDPKKDDSETIH